MKKTMLMLVLVAMSGMGCVGMAKIARELKNDRATVKMRVQTIYGSFEFERDGTANTNSPAR